MTKLKFFSMKKISILILLYIVLISFSGCGPQSPDYISGEILMIEPEPEPDSDWLYKDGFISAQFRPFLRVNQKTGFLDGVALELENYTNETIEIIWDSAVFVDIDGSTSGLAGLDGEITYSDMENKIPNTTIAAGTEREIFLVPTDSIYYDDDREREPIFTVTQNNIKEVDGSRFEVILPMRITEEVREYEFVFESNIYYWSR